MQRTWVRPTLVLAAVAAPLAIVAIIFLPQLVYPPLDSTDLRAVPGAEKRIELQHSRYRLQSEFRGQVLQSIAGVAIALGAGAAWRQAKISRDGQITDRFSSAIDQLGNENLDVRIGGIYSLERLAEHSGVDRKTIARVLVAFVRTHATWAAGSDADPRRRPLPPVDQDLPWMRDRAQDVQISLHVLGHAFADEEIRISLNRVDLRRSDMTGLQLEGAEFMLANLSHTYMRGANLRRVLLGGTDLRKAILREANLVDTDLSGARLDEADLRGADLQGADLSNAVLKRADLRSANLAGARLEHTDLTDIRQNSATIWPR